MADTHEEQLLNELLDGIRTSDAAMSASGFEPRVMAAWDHRRQEEDPDDSKMTRYAVVCTMAAAVLISTALSIARSANVPSLPTVPRPAPPIAAGNSPVAPITPSPITPSPITPSPIAKSPIAPSPMAFVPLMPLTGHDLSGPFQIVRVQMPRASLGAMAPRDYPDPFVEAEVLLGEDGMARAIRVSTNGSVNRWRSR